jgi:hypothetical protein
MAEVRDFNSYTGKKLNNDDTDDKQQPSYNERIRNHKLVVMFRTFLLTAVFIIVISMIYIHWRDKSYSEANITKSVSVIDSTGASNTELDGQILRYSKDGVSLLDVAGEALWNITYQMQNPIVHKCQGMAAIGDYNGHLIYIVNGTGQLGEIDTNLPIRDFCVSAQGVVAAILDDTDVTWIYLYSSSGQEIASFKTTMKDSGYPTAVSISPNAELVGVSYLYAKDGDIQTSVAFYNFGSVGQNEIDNYVSGYDYPGAVVPYMQFMTESSVFAVSDDRIMFYSGSEKPTSQAENLVGEDQIKSVFSSSEYAGLVLYNGTTDGAYRLITYNTSGNKVAEIYFDLEYSDIIFDNNQIIIYNEDYFNIYDVDGHLKYEGQFERSVEALITTNVRSKFILVTEGQILTMELR